jgi:DNA mismatch endonuclease, patch repair protein
MSNESRSYTMSQIRSSGNNSTELRMIYIMRQNGIKDWRRNQNLLGKPDFVFWKSRVALFIDGCFWHCCPRCFVKPKSNIDYWQEKAKKNRARDRMITNELTSRNWKVIRIWEHSLKRPRWVVAKLRSVLQRGLTSDIL